MDQGVEKYWARGHFALVGADKQVKTVPLEALRPYSRPTIPPQNSLLGRTGRAVQPLPSTLLRKPADFSYISDFRGTIQKRGARLYGWMCESGG